MKRNAKKYVEDGIRFDSKIEMDFYHRFIRGKGYRFEHHKRFYLTERYTMGGVKCHACTYAPDFVIKDKDGHILHVFDVKGSLSNYDMDKDAKKTFRWFQSRYRIPVEIVVPRTHDFKMKILDIPRGLQSRHAKRDRQGNVKCYKKTGNPMYDYYDVHHSIDYDVSDTIGR